MKLLQFLRVENKLQSLELKNKSDKNRKNQSKRKTSPSRNLKTLLNWEMVTTFCSTNTIIQDWKASIPNGPQFKLTISLSFYGKRNNNKIKKSNNKAKRIKALLQRILQKRLNQKDQFREKNTSHERKRKNSSVKNKLTFYGNSYPESRKMTGTSEEQCSD